MITGISNFLQAERIQSIYLFFAEHFFPDCAQRLMQVCLCVSACLYVCTCMYVFQSSSVALENLEFPELQSDNRTSLLLVLYVR